MATFTDTEAQNLSVHDSVSYLARPGALASSHVNLHDALSFAYRPGALVSENIHIHPQLSLTSVYHTILSDLVRIHPAAAKAVTAAIAENFSLHDVVTYTLAVVVAERLGLHDVFSSSAHLNTSVAETIRLHPQLAWFLGGLISENLTLHESIAQQWRWARSLSDNITLHGTVTPRLIIRLTAADNLSLTDHDVLRAIFKATIADGISMSLGFIDPGGGFTAWAINSRTGAVTEYQNFAFNSFAQMGHHFLGASSGGLYALDGNLDDTAAVVARVKSGSAQFSGSRFTSFEAIYLGLRVSDSGNDWLLKLYAGDGRTYTYAFRPLNQRTTKVFVGKGLRSRYFAWELTTAGEDFDMDSIEFVPISAKRRV